MKNFEEMRAEEDERAYQEWEMSKPGYWTGKLIRMFVLIAVVTALFAVLS